MGKKVNRFKSLEVAVTVAELMIFTIERGGHIKGFTDDEALNWSFRECPICGMYHDNRNSKFCSYECTLQGFEV